MAVCPLSIKRRRFHTTYQIPHERVLVDAVGLPLLVVTAGQVRHDPRSEVTHVDVRGVHQLAQRADELVDHQPAPQPLHLRNVV